MNVTCSPTWNSKPNMLIKVTFIFSQCMCMTIKLVCDWLLVLVRMFPHFTACLLRCSHLLCQVAFVFQARTLTLECRGGGVLVGCICLVGSWVLDAVRVATLDHMKQHKACGSGLSIQLYAYGFQTWVAPLVDWSQWCSMEARLVNHLQMVGVGSVKSFGGQNRGLTRPYGPADQFPHCTWLLQPYCSHNNCIPFVCMACKFPWVLTLWTKCSWEASLFC